jgi:hypothetical protein
VSIPRNLLIVVPAVSIICIKFDQATPNKQRVHVQPLEHCSFNTGAPPQQAKQTRMETPTMGVCAGDPHTSAEPA